MAYTIPPDNRTSGNSGHLSDHTSIADVLNGMGDAFNVQNTAWAGGADPTGSADSTSAIAACVTAASTAGRPVYIPKGTYKISSALNWKLPGLVVIGDGSANTTITQNTSNTPVVMVAGQGQRIYGLRLNYLTQQGSGNTSAIGMQFGDDTVGSCFESIFEDIYVQLAYTGLSMNAALVTTAGLFSCYFRNIHVLGWFNHAIGLAGNAGGGNSNSTGCVFDNTYLHNNFSGSPAASNSYPVFLESWDEIVFNQLNVEHGESFILDVIGLSGVTNCVINGLHIESIQLSGSSGNAAYINCDTGSGVVVNGLNVRFGTMSGSTDNSVVRFSGSSGGYAEIHGFNEGSENTFSHAHPWADFGSVASCTFQVTGIQNSLVSTNYLNLGTGCTVQVGQPNHQGIFGDGSDGAVVFDGTTTILGLVPSSNIYTMTRDIYCTSITINSGVTVKTSGSRIFCTGTLTNAGTINSVGNAGTASAGGASNGSQTLVGGRPGGTPAIGAGGAGTAGGVGTAAAGAGGAGSGNAGGAAGTSPATSTSYFRTVMPALVGLLSVAAADVITGGAGGGAGGGDGTNKGGGGGGGAGVIIIFAHAMVNTGTITVQGGAGFQPTTGNCGGGGGGSGGLVLIYTLTAWTNTGTTTLTAGALAAGVGTGSAGSAGGTGNLLNVVVQ